MSRKNLIYFIFIFCLTNLFFDESWGLNALIAAIITIIYSLLQRPEMKLRNFHWYAASGLFLINGLAIVLTGHGPSTLWFIFSLFYFLSAHHFGTKSIIYSIAEGFGNFFEGFYRLSVVGGKAFKKEETANKSKTIFQFLIYGIPIIIIIVFLKLYQTADDTFYEWTKFINLDWISWPFIVTYLLFALFSYGLCFYERNTWLAEKEAQIPTRIESSTTDKLHQFLGLETESKIAILLLLTLSLMLGLFILIDFRVIIMELPNPDTTFRYSNFLHKGVASLITSIVLVIIIISILFRGQLNFKGRKSILFLAQIWLILNLLLVLTTTIKNYEYIIHWGLTYKRIGVYIYLLLAALGLIFTLIKIKKKQTVWVVIRRMAFTFFVYFSLHGMVNWDRLIVYYNMQSISTEKIDFNYLAGLKDEAYPALLQFYRDSPEIAQKALSYDEWDRLFTQFGKKWKSLNEKINTTTWRSYTYYDYQLFTRLRAVHPVYLSFKKLNYEMENRNMDYR